MLNNCAVAAPSPLDQAAATGQWECCCHSPINLILSNCLQFRWYPEGRQQKQVCPGHLDSQGGIRMNPALLDRVNALLQDFLNVAPVTVDHTEALARTMATKTRLLRDAMVLAFWQRTRAQNRCMIHCRTWI